MIARAESGQARGNMDDFDAADVANGIQDSTSRSRKTTA